MDILTKTGISIKITPETHFVTYPNFIVDREYFFFLLLTLPDKLRRKFLMIFFVFLFTFLLFVTSTVSVRPQLVVIISMRQAKEKFLNILVLRKKALQGLSSSKSFRVFRSFSFFSLCLIHSPLLPLPQIL